MNDIDARIRDALRAATDEIGEQDLRPATPPTAGRDRRAIRWVAPMLAAAAVAAVVATSVALSGSPSATHDVRPGGNSSPVIAPGPNPSVIAQPTAASRRAPAPHIRACFFADACGGVNRPSYEPLWPFRSYDEAVHWERVDGPAGHSPWHSDARATALFFTRNYLGFADIGIVTSAQVGTDEAHIGVGYRDPSGTKRTSAVLHLVRYETTVGDKAAGWEIAGSDDTSFSLERPAYGSRVASPTTAGGHITGVDENIAVAVRTLASAHVDHAGPVPAGGTHSPWAVTVPFAGRGVLTIVAVTGGHLQQHERFAIQGVHT
jgi:hypothetical protein